jgi:hypothetical protein
LGDMLGRAWALLRDQAAWISHHLVEAVTLGGVVAYGALRLSAGMFYERLGFRPEEVGSSYLATLGRGLEGAVWGLFGLWVTLMALAFALLLVTRAWARHKTTSSEDPPQPRLLDQVREFDWRANRGAAFELSLLFLVVMVLVAGLDGSSVALGRIPSPFLPRFQWPAQPALIHLSGHAPRGLRQGQCVIYLGESDGVFALYDPSSKSSWRINASVVTVETGSRPDRIGEVSDDC